MSKQTNKSPYEIREDVLAMAKDYMDSSWKLNVEFTQKLFEKGEKTTEEVQNALTPYSMEKLIEKATEMYAFVTKKD